MSPFPLETLLPITYRGYTKRWRKPTYRLAVEREAERIKADGCSGVPDFFRIICDEHDIHYATHRDFFEGFSLTQEEADLYLRWGIQFFSWFGRLSPMAWWRYRVVSRRHLGLGRAAWLSGPKRLRDRGVVALVAACLVMAGCASTPPPPITTAPIQGCDFRVVDLNRRLCAENRGTLVVDPSWTHPCGACVLP